MEGLQKTGEAFYIQMPEKIDKIFVTSGVIKDEFGSMKASDTYYESGTGSDHISSIFHIKRDLRWNLIFQRSIRNRRRNLCIYRKERKRCMEKN